MPRSALADLATGVVVPAPVVRSRIARRAGVSIEVEALLAVPSA